MKPFRITILFLILSTICLLAAFLVNDLEHAEHLATAGLFSLFTAGVMLLIENDPQSW